MIFFRDIISVLLLLKSFIFSIDNPNPREFRSEFKRDLPSSQLIDGELSIFSNHDKGAGVLDNAFGLVIVSHLAKHLKP